MTSSFLFVTCQVGAEGAVKSELARERPGMRFAYSRPGFLTFKLPEGHAFDAGFDLRSVFARAYGLSLGKAEGTSREERARSVWKLAADLPVGAVHVWGRDTAAPGGDGFEPGITETAREIEREILSQRPADISRVSGDATRPPPVPPSEGGERIALDCVIVSEEEWWVGYHRMNSVPSSWPGGFMPVTSPSPPLAVSRGYFKLIEALLWSQLPLQPGERCVEIGSAPGGAAQALLERGLFVTGIDPAEMHPEILNQPRFRHIRRRAKDVRRREFAEADWLVADINLPPKYTLDTLEAILKHPGVQPRGMILTLKLREWSLADQLPEFLDRIRGWKFTDVRARQLQHNRQEVCVVARKNSHFNSR